MSNSDLFDLPEHKHPPSDRNKQQGKNKHHNTKRSKPTQPESPSSSQPLPQSSPPPKKLRKKASAVPLGMESWKKLNRKPWNTKPCVMLIGPPGAAKSTLLTAASLYADYNYDTLSNPVRNPEGVGYMKNTIANLKKGVFVQGNKVNDLYLYEKTFGFPEGEIVVNFVETSGEAFVGLEPPAKTDKERTAQQEFCLKALSNFISKNDLILILLVVPFDKAYDNDQFFDTVLSRIKILNPNLLKNVGLVVTKWDFNEKRGGNKKFRSVTSFLKSEMRSTYSMLKSEYVERAKIFRFSIGKVQMKEKKGEYEGVLKGPLRLKDCRSIIEWIRDCFVVQPKTQEAEIQGQQIHELEQLSERIGAFDQALKQAVEQEKRAKAEQAQQKGFWKVIVNKLKNLFHAA